MIMGTKARTFQTQASCLAPWRGKYGFLISSRKTFLTLSHHKVEFMYHGLRSILNIPSRNPHKTLYGRDHYYPHFMDGESEAERVYAIDPRSQSCRLRVKHDYFILLTTLLCYLLAETDCLMR